MKYTRLLSAVAVAVMTTAVVNAAEDFTSELYLPSELETLSDTKISYQRKNFKNNGSKEDFVLRETALIGFGNEAAILASVGNRFNFKYLTNGDYNNDLNLDYELGIKKNLRFSNGAIAQFGASYYTYNPRSWYGRSGEAKAKIRKAHGNTRWYKELRGEAKVGYELEEGLMPYASVEVQGNIDDTDRELYYTTFAGVHKLEYNYAFDGGLRYEFDFGSDRTEAWYMQMSSDYFLNDTMSVGGLVDYRFAGSSDPKIDYGYSMEARFKVLF